MHRFVAIDSGKYQTKYASCDENGENIITDIFRTKITDNALMDDDYIEKATCIVEIDGKTYKVGNRALRSADLVTSKKSDIHRISTLTAIAKCCSDDEIDDIDVAFGIPIADFDNRVAKMEYKDFILPKLELDEKATQETKTYVYKPSDVIEVTLRETTDSIPITKRFRILSKVVYPESSGVFYENPILFANRPASVIDIGNLNINCMICNNFEYITESIITADLGGSIMMTRLMDKVRTELQTPCDLNTIAYALKHKRVIPFSSDANKEKEERSTEIINSFLLEYASDIKAKCLAKNWALDNMIICFIGGTTELISDELKAVFGSGIYIPDEPTYCNVLGFLKLLYSKRTKKNLKIAKPVEETANTEEKEEVA